MSVNEVSETMIGSEIIKMALEVNERISKGEKIFNFTIGDFDPDIFPIPSLLEEFIVQAYREKKTNYPTANGVPELRNEVSKFIQRTQDLTYPPDDILIAGGARPLIYAFFKTVVNPGEKIIIPVPSWNNNHYSHLSSANSVFIETKPENMFMPEADSLKSHLEGAGLLALCSPLNPTGTIFSKKSLEEICDLVIEENKRRGKRKPLYVLFDQIYFTLIFGKNRHYNPVSLRPEMRPFTLFADGISKSFSATGVRVGWAFGPKRVIDKMRALLAHIGAWAPKPEQVGLAKFFSQPEAVQGFLDDFSRRVEKRLNKFYDGILELQKKNFPIRGIPPQAAIYLTVELNLSGWKTPDGKTIRDSRDVYHYLLNEAKVALVPFFAFGAAEDSFWFRLSVGTCKTEEIPEALMALEKALFCLSKPN